VALTAYPDKAVEWGVDETRVLPFNESVGGRYSLWSSIGFPVALALGWEDFAEFLDGAAAMDRHFLEADGLANLPLRAAFADLYYTRLRGCQTRACFAYDERLRLLPSYLQQLEMESNGKSGEGGRQRRLMGPTAPITWGGVGTDAQHAVFQLLHQGTNLVPVDFIAAIIPGDSLDPAHHRNLLANCFAQGAALMAGKDAKDPARAYPGDRPFGDDPVRRSEPGHAGRADRVPRTPHLCQRRADGASILSISSASNWARISPGRSSRATPRSILPPRRCWPPPGYLPELSRCRRRPERRWRWPRPAWHSPCILMPMIPMPTASACRRQRR
jgi:hypothetical protein